MTTTYKLTISYNYNRLIGFDIHGRAITEAIICTRTFYGIDEQEAKKHANNFFSALNYEQSHIQWKRHSREYFYVY